MNTWLLDTSAVLAHFHKETGYNEVQALFDDPTAVILVGAPVLLELDNALKQRTVDEGHRRVILDWYGGQLAEVAAVDKRSVLAALTLRHAATTRLPAMDALIAGCAAAHDAVLVHSDPHFDAIPPRLLRKWNLLHARQRPSSDDSHVVVKEERAAYTTKRRRKS